MEREGAVGACIVDTKRLACERKSGRWVTLSACGVAFKTARCCPN
jgi:hypothetical protein